MSAVTKLWLFSLCLIGLRCADVWITFVVSPDLRWEINPLVSVAGLGWSALIAANVVGTALVIGLAVFSATSQMEFYPSESGYTQKEFVSHYLFGERHSFHKIYYVVPSNKRAIVQYCGYVFMRVLTVWSFIVVVYNILVWYSESFRLAISNFSLWITVYLLLVLLVFAYSLGFFKSLYADYGAMTTRH